MKDREPKLRFQNFTKQWKETTLDAIADWKSGGTPSKNISEYWGGEIPWISAASMSGKYLNKSLRTLTKKGVDSGSRIAPKGSLLLLVRGSMLFNKVPVGIAEVDVAFNQDLKSLLLKEGIDNHFLYNWFIYSQHKLMNKVVGTGIGAGKLDTQELKNFQIRIPSLVEQQKIASFLISVDKRIQLLKQKKEKLETYKNGVMQQLFSQEVRFKQEDGSDFPDWEEKSLGEIGKFQTSSVDKLTKENEQKVFLVNYMNVYRHENITKARRHELQEVSARDSQVETSNLKRGDILFTPSSETPTDIGHSVVMFEDLENTLFSYHLIRFRPKIELNLLYSHYFCNIPSVLKQLSRFATGSTRFTISTGNFSKVKVKLPCMEEQKKIAKFLKSIDDSIQKVEEQIEGMNQFKKGLLQQMFV